VRLPLLTKSVTPDSNVPYHGVVTYTLLLSTAAARATRRVGHRHAARAGGLWQLGAELRRERGRDQITWRGAVAPPMCSSSSSPHTHRRGIQRGRAQYGAGERHPTGERRSGDVCRRLHQPSRRADYARRRRRQPAAGAARDLRRGLDRLRCNLAGQTIVLGSSLGLTRM